LRPILKSNKLDDVCYEIRGPALQIARQMEEDGHKIIKLNIGNLAVFGFDPPDEIVRDMILNMQNSAGYTDSKGMFAPRKAIMHYTQEKNIRGVGIDDIYLGNGASELIVMAMQGLLNSGDEVLVRRRTTRCGRRPSAWPAAIRCIMSATSRPAGCPTSTTCARRSRRTRARSSSSTRTIRPARCIRATCCWKSSNWRASTS